MVILEPATNDGVAVPVPPLATAKVPARTTAPLVATVGVKPVVPALNVETPPPLAVTSTIVSTPRTLFFKNNLPS